MYTFIFQAWFAAWDALEVVLINGGWVVLALFLALILYSLKLKHKKHRYIHALDWVFLSVAVPQTPTPSILAADLVFSHLHAIKKNLDFREKYILGMVPPWLSFEIVSLGGLIRYLIRTPMSAVDAVKAAIYAQYPNAEITEAGDYMSAIRVQYNPDRADYDLWGTELMLTKPEAYPIKTYPLFEHRAAETIIDPLAGLLEVMAGIEKHEMIAIQIIAEPSGDDWKAHANHEAQMLKKSGSTHEEDEHAPVRIPQLSQSEKDVINAIQAKLGKLSYLCKVRVLYVAPPDKLNYATRVPAILGAFSQFSSFDLNGFKPNPFTVTKQAVKLSEKYEAKGAAERLLWKKREFVKNFKLREVEEGGAPYHLSTEELATLYHFPLEEVSKAPIVSTEARKGEPPINLPV